MVGYEVVELLRVGLGLPFLILRHALELRLVQHSSPHGLERRDLIQPDGLRLSAVELLALLESDCDDAVLRVHVLHLGAVCQLRPADERDLHRCALDDLGAQLRGFADGGGCESGFCWCCGCLSTLKLA